MIIFDEDANLEPLQLDDWEISPDQIIMDCMLGEGAFGEVYKGLIKGNTNKHGSNDLENIVAVKLLKST